MAVVVCECKWQSENSNRIVCKLRELADDEMTTQLNRADHSDIPTIMRHVYRMVARTAISSATNDSDNRNRDWFVDQDLCAPSRHFTSANGNLTDHFLRILMSLF